MKSSSPLISVLVFGLSLFMLLKFGLGTGETLDEVVSAATPPEESLAMESDRESGGSDLKALPGFKGLGLEPPMLEPVVYRENASAALSGLIVDEEGMTVAGADIHWMSLEGDDTTGVRTTTQARGRFSFTLAPRELTSSWSAIWILHPSHYAEVIVLGPFEDPRVAFGGIRRLESAPVFSGRVVDESGDPVEGAQVWQSLSLGVNAQADAKKEDRGSLRLRALENFTHTTLSDSSGEALLVPVRRDSLLTASLGDARSPQYKCPSEGWIELQLRATFEAHGSVRGRYGPETRVRCEGVAFDEVARLGDFTVGESGEWGPAALPLLDVEEYVFSLIGDVAAGKVRVPREDVTSRLVINFEGVSGVTVPLLVLGPAELPLEGSKTSVYWKQGGSWQSVGATSDEEGFARARGVPSGNAYARVHHEGHVSQMVGPFEVAFDMEPLEVQLEAAGQISGRCTRDGEPVESFQILYWSGDPTQVAREEVKGSEDGTFLIDEAPLGEVTLIGLDAFVANGSPQLVVVNTGEVADVTIELPHPLRASGEVIDAVTGDPVAGANVQVMSAYEGRGLAEFGAEVTTEAGGRFVVTGLSKDAGALRVRAQDYIEDFVITRIGAGEAPDLGLIALQPSRELFVQLDGPDGTSYAGFRVGLVDFEHLGVLEANHLGSVKFQDIPNGVVQLNIYHPDNSITAFAGSLRPEDDGRILVPISSGQRLYVQVLPRPGDDLPQDLFVGVGGMLENGSEVVQWLRDEGRGRFLLEHARSGPTVIRAVAKNGEVYAMRRFDLPSDRESEIQLELGEEDDLLIRVVDSENLPVSNAMVSIYLPRSDPCFFVRNLVTGSSGEVRVSGFGFPHAQVTVSHETKGSGDVGFVDIDALGGEPLVVRLEAPARLRVVVHDEGEPVIAATASLCAVEPLLNGAGFGERTTGQDGGATWDALMPGEYELYVHGVGLWPTRQRIEAAENGGRQLIEVRRTGQLTLLLFGGRGGAIAGAEVELHCAELGVSLSGWLAEGRLPGASTLTDAEGRLALPPLPHGTWTWSATAPDGRSGAGVLDLPPGEHLEVVGLLQ